MPEVQPPPLDGLLVLDLTQYLSGPFTTQILGDLGATVIKIEPPAGDLSRTVAPYATNGESSYFLSINRNKRSITADLKSSEGQRLVQSIAMKADIVVENFRPGVAARLGLGYDELIRKKPDLVYCSVSGFGQTGPYRDLPAFDMIAQAIGGVMSLNGHPPGPSARVGVPIGDVVAGMYAAIGVLAGMQRRHSTGEGSWVDVSMLDSQVSLLTYLASSYLTSGAVPGLQGRGHQAVPTYRSFTCKDGVEVVITANTEGMWKRLCGALEIEHLADDPKYATADARLENRGVLEPFLETRFLEWTAEEIMDRLRGHVPIAPINSVSEALEDAQVEHRAMLLEMPRGDGESTRVVGSPLKFVGIPLPEMHPPQQGEDLDWVLENILGEDAKESPVDAAHASESRTSE